MLERRSADNGVCWYVAPVLASIGLRHAFSTRRGGISEGPFAALNLGRSSASEVVDDEARVEANYALFQSAVGVAGMPRCTVRQVHGHGVARVAAAEPFDRLQPADALVSDDPARLLSVRCADCVPVLLASVDGGAVAAVHAGWRGVLAGVVTHALLRLRAIAGRGELRAAIGPSIGPVAFEVGDDVAARFADAFGSAAPVRRRPGARATVDLKRAIALQLAAAGLAPRDVDVSAHCTASDPHEFFSHRRDRGVTGQMAAVIAPRGAA